MCAYSPLKPSCWQATRHTPLGPVEQRCRGAQTRGRILGTRNRFDWLRWAPESRRDLVPADWLDSDISRHSSPEQGLGLDPKTTKSQTLDPTPRP